MESLSFKGNMFFKINDCLNVPLPDGYKYKINGDGQNADWSYIIPQNILFEKNHIDAKPFSFAVSDKKTISLQLNANDHEKIEQTLLKFNLLKSGNETHTKIISKNCFFLFQVWKNDLDMTYNKINGFIFSNGDLYQFHFYANYNENLSFDTEIETEAIKMFTLWMDKVFIEDDDAYEEKVPTGDINEVYESIKHLYDGVNKTNKSILEHRENFKEELQIHYIAIAINFFETNNLQIKSDTLDLLNCMIGEFNGSKITEKIINDIKKKEISSDSSIKYYLNSVISKNIIGQFIKCDQILNTPMDQGFTYIYCNAIKELLLVLCFKNEVNFNKNEYCQQCIQAINDVISERNNSTHATILWKGSSSIATNQKNTRKTLINSEELEMSPPKIIRNKPVRKELKKKIKPRITMEDFLKGYDESDIYVCTSDNIKKKVPSSFSYKVIIFDESVNEIKASYFKFCTRIERIYIGGNVEKIGNKAFDNCFRLVDVYIGDIVKEIGKSAFSGCSSLSKVYIGDSVTNIDKDAFSGCTSLAEIYIGDSVKEIVNKAFFYCTKLSKVYIGDSVTNIDKHAFSGCTSLAEIYIGDSVENLGEFAFFGCTSLAEVYISDSVKNIGESAFSGCTSLAEVYIGDSVENLGEFAFSGCTSLAEVYIGDSVKNIGESAFSSCTSLAKVYIGDSVKNIGKGAFSNCTSLAGAYIGDSIENLGEFAFLSCTSLAKVYIGKSLKQLTKHVFMSCENLEVVTLPKRLVGRGKFSKNIKLIKY